MEEWQEWQIRADQIAQELRAEVEALQVEFLSNDDSPRNLRAFWPRLRDLKERVRTAPAIRLEDKLDLERRLRNAGGRAYKVQEATFARSADRKADLLGQVSALRSRAEAEQNPRELRNLRRDFERLRETFDSGDAMTPADRQSVWDAWREAHQFAWQKLVGIWDENEAGLREILSSARDSLERGNSGAARQAVGRFFDALKSREAKQTGVTAMKAEADDIRRQADELDERAAAVRVPGPRSPSVPAIDTWRADLSKNREAMARLNDEVSSIESEVQNASTILEQAMLKGTLLDKKRKLNELVRASRALELRISQSEEPLVPTG